MNKGEREFIDTRFKDMKDHFSGMFDQASEERKSQQKQIGRNTNFRLISTGVVLTVSFLAGVYTFIKSIFGGWLN